jgi:hypothetical protein
LLAAAITANTETFTRLVERGADVTARDADGQSVADLVDAATGADGIGPYLEELRSHDAETRAADPSGRVRATPRISGRCPTKPLALRTRGLTWGRGAWSG